MGFMGSVVGMVSGVSSGYRKCLMYGHRFVSFRPSAFAPGFRELCEACVVGRLSASEANLLKDGIAIMALLWIGTGLP